MEELDVDGLFWLAGQPGDKVAGRLRFDPLNGARLDLIGAFRNQVSSGARDESVMINGDTGKHLLTLYRCIRTGIRAETANMVRESYSPEVILSGADFEEAELLGFSGVSLELSHLDEWVWKPSTNVEFKTDDAGKRTGEIQIDHKPNEESRVYMDVGELELGYSYSYRLDSITETTIGQRCFIRMRFKEPRSLDAVIKEGTYLQNLVTIALHLPSSFTKVTLSHPAKIRELPNGRVFSEPIEMYAQFRGNNTPREKETIHPMQMLFTFDDIGGVDGLAKWVEISAKYRLVIDSLLSHWYLPTIYTDNRLLNIIIAAEALERIRLQQQNINFSDALKNLAKLAGSPFVAMVNDVDTWVEEIVRARINYLVHRGLHGNLEGQRMYTLSESLYFLVVLYLLRECGIPEKTLSRIQDHQRFRWAAKQLQSEP